MVNMTAHPSIVVVSDVHCGSIMAPWPDGHPVEGGGEYRSNKPQKWLTRCWDDMVQTVSAMPAPPILVLNGDLVQGSHAHRDGQLVSGQLSIQCGAAGDLLSPLVKLCRVLYVIRGSEWHDGRAAESIEALAELLGAVQDPDTQAFTRWGLYLDLGGRVIHFAHHRSVTSLPYTQPNSLFRDGYIQQAELLNTYGGRAPNLQAVIRSHSHQYSQAHSHSNLTTATTPSWQLMTAYVAKRYPASLAHIGWLEIVPTESRLIVEPHLYPLPRPAIVKVEVA